MDKKMERESMVRAGFRSLAIEDRQQGLTFPTLVFYPTATASRMVNFGPFPLDVAVDAEVHGADHPLVLISHGSGGTPWLYRTLARHLACCGFVVAMPEHAGDNRGDHQRSGTIENLQLRPRHLSLVIDALQADARFAPHLRRPEVAVIGHSLGGYSALALAGAEPWAGPGQRIEVASDPRVRALVLLAPATSWFVPNESLRNVRIPILMFAAGEDRITPSWQSQLVLDLIPERGQITFHPIAGAGHYSFLSPFPDMMMRPDFPPSQDPPGFDRRAFHESLNEIIRGFLQHALKL